MAWWKLVKWVCNCWCKPPRPATSASIDCDGGDSGLNPLIGATCVDSIETVLQPPFSLAEDPPRCFGGEPTPCDPAPTVWRAVFPCWVPGSDCAPPNRSGGGGDGINFVLGDAITDNCDCPVIYLSFDPTDNIQGGVVGIGKPRCCPCDAVWTGGVDPGGMTYTIHQTSDTTAQLLVSWATPGWEFVLRRYAFYTCNAFNRCASESEFNFAGASIVGYMPRGLTLEFVRIVEPEPAAWWPSTVISHGLNQ